MDKAQAKTRRRIQGTSDGDCRGRAGQVWFGRALTRQVCLIVPETRRKVLILRPIRDLGQSLAEDIYGTLPRLM